MGLKCHKKHVNFLRVLSKCAKIMKKYLFFLFGVQKYTFCKDSPKKLCRRESSRPQFLDALGLTLWTGYITDMQNVGIPLGSMFGVGSGGGIALH